MKATIILENKSKFAGFGPCLVRTRFFRLQKMKRRCALYMDKYGTFGLAWLEVPLGVAIKSE